MRPGGDEGEGEAAAGRGAEADEGLQVRGGAFHDYEASTLGRSEDGDDVGVRREASRMQEVSPHASEHITVITTVDEGQRKSKIGWWSRSFNCELAPRAAFSGGMDCRI